MLTHNNSAFDLSPYGYLEKKFENLIEDAPQLLDTENDNSNMHVARKAQLIPIIIHLLERSKNVNYNNLFWYVRVSKMC